jgi:hypothetical protein
MENHQNTMNTIKTEKKTHDLQDFAKAEFLRSRHRKRKVVPVSRHGKPLEEAQQ